LRDGGDHRPRGAGLAQHEGGQKRDGQRDVRLIELTGFLHSSLRGDGFFEIS